MPTTAYRATFDDYAGTPIRSRGFGRNGCRGGIVGVGSFGTNSLRSESVTHCRQPGSSIATPSRAKLFHEEPKAGKLHQSIEFRSAENRSWSALSTASFRPDEARSCAAREHFRCGCRSSPFFTKLWKAHCHRAEQ